MKTVLERYQFFAQYTLMESSIPIMVLADVLNEINNNLEYITEKIKNHE